MKEVIARIKFIVAILLTASNIFIVLKIILDVPFLHPEIVMTIYVVSGVIVAAILAF